MVIYSHALFSWFLFEHRRPAARGRIACALRGRGESVCQGLVGPGTQLMVLDFLRGLAAIHPVLHAEKRVAASLEDTAELECPGDGGLGREEPKDLHGVASKPIDQDRDAEPFTRPGPGVDQDLGKRQHSFDAETNISNQIRVRLVDRGNRGKQKLANHESDC